MGHPPSHSSCPRCAWACHPPMLPTVGKDWASALATRPPCPRFAWACHPPLFAIRKPHSNLSAGGIVAFSVEEFDQQPDRLLHVGRRGMAGDVQWLDEGEADRGVDELPGETAR